MHNGGGPRILVIEDDDAVRDALTSALEHEGYDVRAHAEGLDLPATLEGFDPDLALLDIRLAEGPDGLALGRRIRADGDVPILFLTAADGVADRLAGFRAGADDYVTKPFAMAELLARVEALLRRAGRLTRSTFTYRDVEVRLDDRTATRGGTLLDLTRTEFDLLVALLRADGKVLSKTQLLATVWDYEEYDPNLVEVHVSALRRKLEARGPRIVQTVRGFGYAVRDG